MSPDAGGGGEVAGSQPMSTAVHRSPIKLWRSNSIFKLCYFPLPCGDLKCRDVKTGFCRKRYMQTGSSETLIGWKSEKTTPSLGPNGGRVAMDSGIYSRFTVFGFVSEI
jgi:hypothetical protein